jgi:capsular exopolysaccharide synthesis family protein
VIGAYAGWTSLWDHASPQAECRVALKLDRSPISWAELAPYGPKASPPLDLVALAASKEVAEKAALELSNPALAPTLLAALRAEPDRGRGEAARLVARAGSPAEAARWANAVGRALEEAGRLRMEALRDQAARAIELKLKDLRDRVDAQKIASGQEQDQIRDRERRLGAASAGLAEIERQVEEAQARKQKALGRTRSLELDDHRLREALPAGPEEDTLSSPVLDRLRAEIASIRSDMALKGINRAPDGPEYKVRSARIAELREELRSELYRERAQAIVGLQESARDIDDEIRTLDERRLRKALEIRHLGDELRGLEPGREELADFRRQIGALEDMNRRLMGPLPSPVVIETEAREEGERGTRGSRGFLVAALVALLAGLGVAAWREASDTRLRNDADVKRFLNLPCLALVERASGDPLIHRYHPQDPQGEAFSVAATLLRSYLAEHEFRTCLVTSARNSEGKSTMAANLAVALARKGLRVALVDADLRQPRLHELFGLDNARGLSTLLLGPEPAEPEPDPETLFIPTEMPNLRILPSGPIENLPPELIDSVRMIDLLRGLRERHDAVLLDGPPLIAGGDALALARLSDTAVWVVRAGQADGRSLSWAKHLLKNVRADLAGVLLNFAPAREGERVYAYPAHPERG